MLNEILLNNPTPNLSPYKTSIVKVDKQSGEIIWRNRFSPTLDSTAWTKFTNITLTHDSLYLTGYISSRFTMPFVRFESQTILQKINKDGHTVWSYTAPMYDDEYWINHIEELADGSIVYSSNTFKNIMHPVSGAFDQYWNHQLRRIDTLGNTLWK